jgi:hypothetical protein
MQRTFLILRRGSERWFGPTLVAIGLAFILSPQVASAQTFRTPDPEYQGIILQAYGAFVVPMGADLEGVDVGPGVGAGFRWVFPNMISGGGGIRYSSHNVSGFSQHTEFLTIFGQIGYTFIFDSTPLRPTLGGRIGWTTQKLPAVFNANRNGLSVGAFGGVEVPLSDIVALAGSLTFDFLAFEELPGNPVDGTAQLFAVEAGVVIIP